MNAMRATAVKMDLSKANLLLEANRVEVSPRLSAATIPGQLGRPDGTGGSGYSPYASHPFYCVPAEFMFRSG